MSEEPPLMDYYAGVMRGYLLALNAPQQILHAHDVILTGYRSRAGGVVHPTERDIQANLKDLRRVAEVPKTSDLPFMETRESDKYVLPKGEEAKTAVHTPTNDHQDSETKKFFWDAAEDQLIRDEKEKGTKAKIIAKMLGHGRTHTSVNTRIAVLKSRGKWDVVP